jgi:hypothetical protein
MCVSRLSRLWFIDDELLRWKHTLSFAYFALDHFISFQAFFEDQGTIKLVEWGRGCLVLDVLVVFDAQPTFYNGMGYDICRDGRFRSSSNFR